MDDRNRIGAYLRARRELLRPEDVGMHSIGRRRVPGLRREEIATLAGISADYYLRLEQGRERHPSDDVLVALAGALKLDEDATAYLHRLAHPALRRAKTARRTQRVHDGILRLLASWDRTPGVVESGRMDVLAANALARALSPLYVPGTNLVHAIYLNPKVRSHYGDQWERIAASTVARVRALVDPNVDDPTLRRLVGELSMRSEAFRRAWARHDVRTRASGAVTMYHPTAGPLELAFERLALPDSDGQTLVVYHAEPGSATERALDELASQTAAADDREAREPNRSRRPITSSRKEGNSSA